MTTSVRPPDVDEAIQELEKQFAEIPWGERRVMVLIKLPAMPQASEVVYGCRFEVAVGDAVICPPSRTSNGEFIGMVTSLVDDGTYKGPIKYLLRKA